MLAWRTTWLVKQGMMEEAAEWASEAFRTECARNKTKGGGIRIYTPQISPYVLVFEENWATVADYEAFWEELPARPAYADSSDTRIFIRGQR